PILPPAPGLFSTTTLCFRLLESPSATSRASRSVVPPGPKGTIICIGRVGQSSAECAENAKQVPATAMAAAAHFVPARRALPALCDSFAYLTVFLHGGNDLAISLLVARPDPPAFKGRRQLLSRAAGKDRGAGPDDWDRRCAPHPPGLDRCPQPAAPPTVHPPIAVWRHQALR